MSSKGDWKFLLEFASEIDDIKYMVEFYSDIRFRQLHCLWVAYCIKHDQEPDTYNYDNGMKELFSILCKKNPQVFTWDFFDAFDMHMAEHLV